MIRGSEKLSRDERDVFERISEDGPMCHEKLADELGYEWYELQPFIRSLWTRGLVVKRLDRRYEVNE